MKHVLAGFFSVLSVASAGDDVVDRIVEHARQHLDGLAPHSFERAAYTGDTRHLPIGVFDSGIGGMTVLEAILALDEFNNHTHNPGPDGIPDFAGERFIYFGDQANMPYGNYSKENRTDHLRELILKDMMFLLGRRYSVDERVMYDKPPVKAIVVACNTATAFGLDDMRRAIGTWGLPVIVVGVVEAGARGLRDTPGAADHGVGILATAGTCASGAYPHRIARTLSLAGRPQPPLVQQGGVSFAATIEGDPLATRSVAQEAEAEIRSMMRHYLETAPDRPLGTIMLGCTHYPLAIRELRNALDSLRGEPDFSPWLASEITFVDPAKWTAAELYRELGVARLRMPAGAACVQADHAFFLSVPDPTHEAIRLAPDGGFAYDYKYGRDPGNLNRPDTRIVPILPNQIPASSARLVENNLPLVWHALASASSLSE